MSPIVRPKGDFKLNEPIYTGAPEGSDEEFCERIRQGDADAVEILVHRYLPMIRHLTGVYRGGRVEAEDLMQEGLMGLFRAMKAYDASKGASFKTFAYTCASNRMLSALVVARAPVLKVSADAVHPAAPDDPQQLLIERERYASLLGSIQDLLSDLENQTLRLYLSGVSYEEMAAHLGVTTKAVDNALQRVRRKLKAVL